MGFEKMIDTVEVFGARMTCDRPSPHLHPTSTMMLRLLAVAGAAAVSQAFVGPRPSHTRTRLYNEADRSESNVVKPDILLPFPPAADPNYRNVGDLGQGDFVISREGGPRDKELANENILRIVRIECSDLQVNTLVWKCLGYRFRDGEWHPDEVFPKWKEKYPSPPDFIGMQRIYEKEIDQPSLRANQALVRSVPVEHKQSLKQHLRPLGFTGYQYAELTPNKTRRAQCANWLLYYREELFGYSIEELRERRAQKQAQEASAAQAKDTEWKPPVKEVF